MESLGPNLSVRKSFPKETFQEIFPGVEWDVYRWHQQRKYNHYSIEYFL